MHIEFNIVRFYPGNWPSFFSISIVKKICKLFCYFISTFALQQLSYFYICCFCKSNDSSFLLTETNISLRLLIPPLSLSESLSVCEPCICLSSLIIAAPASKINHRLLKSLKFGYWFILCQLSSCMEAVRRLCRCWIGRVKWVDWSSVPVAKPICVSLLECPLENTLWAWEENKSPLASSQLNWCDMPSFW